MTIGKKIREIRYFRGMTQSELGLAVGFDEQQADSRIRQYESGIRIPRKNMLDKIAKALHVQPANFYTDAPGCAEDILRTLFWLEEDSPNSIYLFQITCNNFKKRDESADSAIRYSDSLDWPFDAPVGIYFNNPLVDKSLREWFLRKQELKAKKITRDEYFEWKLNWSPTAVL